jgi:hypothetical protein
MARRSRASPRPSRSRSLTIFFPQKKLHRSEFLLPCLFFRSHVVHCPQEHEPEPSPRSSRPLVAWGTTRIPHPRLCWSVRCRLQPLPRRCVRCPPTSHAPNAALSPSTCVWAPGDGASSLTPTRALGGEATSFKVPTTPATSGPSATRYFPFLMKVEASGFAQYLGWTRTKPGSALLDVAKWYIVLSIFYSEIHVICIVVNCFFVMQIRTSFFQYLNPFSCSLVVAQKLGCIYLP